MGGGATGIRQVASGYGVRPQLCQLPDMHCHSRGAKFFYFRFQPSLGLRVHGHVKLVVFANSGLINFGQMDLGSRNSAISDCQEDWQVISQQ